MKHGTMKRGNMKPCITFLLCLLAGAACQAQSDPWYLVRGNISTDDSWGLDTDSDGHVYWTTVHKNPPPNGFYDVYLYRIAPDGRQLWRSDPYGGAFNDVAFPVRVAGGYVYAAGRTDYNIWQTDTDPLVLCFDRSTGARVWDYVYTRTPDFGYEEIDGLSIQPDGIFFTAWTKGEAANDMNIMVQQLSHAGQFVRCAVWDYKDLKKHDGANGHMVMDAGHMYVAAHVGKTSVLSGDGNAALVCFRRSDLSFEWVSEWGGTSWDHGLGLTMSSDSMLYMVGHTGSYGGLQQFFIAKFSRSGNLVWSRLWGGSGAELSRAVVTDGDSVIYAAGTTTSNASNDQNIFVLKYDSSGTLLDSLVWGGDRKEVCRDLAFHDGYLYIAGMTESFHQTPGDTASDALLLKVHGRGMRAPDPALSVERVASGEPSFRCYPNPAGETVRIELESAGTPRAWELRIADMAGRTVTTASSVRSSEEIDIRSLPAGVYVARVGSGTGWSFRKLIVMKP